MIKLSPLPYLSYASNITMSSFLVLGFLDMHFGRNTLQALSLADVKEVNFSLGLLGLLGLLSLYIRVALISDDTRVDKSQPKGSRI